MALFSTPVACLGAAEKELFHSGRLAQVPVMCACMPLGHTDTEPGGWLDVVKLNGIRPSGKNTGL